MAETASSTRSETITIDKVAASIATARELEQTMRSIKVKLSVDARGFLRQLRELQLATAPGWIDADPPTFAFPGWGPRWRPWDWSVDAW